MAKTISDEQIKLSIIINGDPAQKQLYDLEKSTRDLVKENKDLLLQKKLLEKQGKKNSEEYRTLTASIKANSATVENNKAKMKELQNQIGITGLTMRQLTDKAKLLRMSLVNAVPGGEAYKRYNAELGQVNTRLDELKGKSNTAKTSIGSLADGFNRYQGMAISVIAGLTGVVLSIQKIIDINGKLSDSQADVRKTTGMTAKEVDELTKSFGLFKTRTSRIDLLGIAEQGGRLGVAKDEIDDFVVEMNKASVALGDSFTGGAEEVATKLGKIKFLFQETKDIGVEEAYNAIGSAINDLGANGVASEVNIAEFTTRIGSLTDVLKPTIQETLALGTAFEESGIEAEISARAYNIFMKQAATESAKFGKVMGISKQAVEDMINANPLEFMLKFAEGMRGMDATKTAQTLDYLGVNADGANKVIGAMGNNMGRFRELIDLSNNSFALGTSLIKEYDIKNNNLAATLSKMNKTVAGWFSSETFIKWLTSSVDWLAKFIGATDDTDGSVSAFKNTLVFTAKVIAIVTAALITNTAWQKLVALWTTRSTASNSLYIIGLKARAFAEGVGTIATQAYAIVTMLLTGNVKGAAQAFRVLTATMMTTPWGFILGAVAAIGVAFMAFSKNTKETASAQSMLKDTMRETDAMVNKQTVSMKTLIAVAQDETASKEARLAAIKQLNAISPEYLKSLSLENIKTAEGQKAIDQYVKSLEKKAMLQVLQKKQLAIMEQMDEKKNMSLDDEVAWYDKAWASIKNLGNASLASNDLMVTAIGRRSTALDELQKKLNFTNAEMEDFLKKNPSAIVDVNPNPVISTFTAPTGSGDETKSNKQLTYLGILQKKLTEVNNAREKLVTAEGITDNNAFEKLTEDAIKLHEEIEKIDMTLSLKSMNEELSSIAEAKIKFAELTIKDDEELKIAILEIRKEQYSGELHMAMKMNMRKKTLTEHEKQMIETSAKNERDVINELNEIKNGLSEKNAIKYIDQKKQQFDIEKIQRETAFNNELAALGNNEKEKEKLRKKFEATEITEQAKFLKTLLADFNAIIGKETVGGFDLTLLTPEQVTKFTEEAAKVGLTLSELIVKKNELAGKQISNAESLGVSKGTTDIFGFTPDNWLQFYDNLAQGKFGIDEMVFAVTALTNAYAKYSEFVSANENAQLQKFTQATDEKKKRLKKQLDSGVINQSTYNKRVEKLDDALDSKKADIEYKQAKRQKLIAMAQIISSTAQAIIGIWAQFPKFDFGATAAIMSGVVGALGALQLATVIKTPLPAKGYEQGLYQDYVKREQDGKMFKSAYRGKTRSGLVGKTSHFMVAEGNRPEMVIDNKAWTQMDPAVKEALVRDLRGIKGFEKGLYQDSVKRSEASNYTATTSPSNDAQMMQMITAVLSKNLEVLERIEQNGVIGKFYKNDLKSAQNIKESINDFDKLRNKNKY